ncbi:hypothetical protein ECC02_013775 [Trypanosoma cruzi]|uniref:Uncharacterized protein n=1 Tax=Trypanosoma cruzi TaxID=5693 RepID=A0A7J6XG53_TRYCR|nr:hypothetical protein ECC02_013775 [Trypanosoma cruzi]
MMLLMLRLGTTRIELQPPLQQLLLLRRRQRLPPMHPPRAQPPPMHPPRTQPPPRHRLLATGAASAALCGFRCRCCCWSVPLWRPPVLRAEYGAGRVRRRSGVPLCAATAHTRGSTDWRLRRVYLSTLQRCGCIYASVFGCACLAYLPPFVLRLVLPGVTIFCFGCRCVLAPCRLPVHSLRRPCADVHLLPPLRHLWGEASVRFYFLFLLFLVCVRSYVFGADCVCACVLVSLRRGVAAQPCLDPTPPLSLSLCVCVCMLCACPCLSLPCCVLSLCLPGAGPTGEFTPRATSEFHKGPSDNDAAPRPLRAFLCPLLCVRVRHGSGGGAV